MAITNQDRVGKALELLKAGLAPFVDREIMAAVKTNSVQMATVQRYAEDPILSKKPISQWDAAGLLKLMWEVWNDVFGRTLGRAERSLVSESTISRYTTSRSAAAARSSRLPPAARSSPGAKS
jgi:hypothetical protein